MRNTERTFMLMGIVVTILLLMHLLPTLTIGDTPLRTVSILSDVFNGNVEQEHQDVIPPPSTSRSLLAEKKGKERNEKDTKAEDFKEIVPPGVTMIEDYGGDNAGGMNHFYAMLYSAKLQNRPVRIAYFGDSFIEGDIYTCDLREMLQEKFGGNGPGWIDAGSVFNKGFRRTILQDYSGIQEFQIVKKPFDLKVQGMNQRYFIPSEGSRINTRATRHMAHASKWQSARLFFRTQQGLTIRVTNGPQEAQTSHAAGSGKVQMIETKGEADKIGYSFANVHSKTYLYGMALESDHGVILDSYSMRGSAGFTLISIPGSTLHDFAELRPIDLFVLHFGLNVISSKTTEASLRHYCKRIAKVVSHLQQAFPYASFLIVSVSDRSQRTAEGITTMKGVEEMVACQREMAAEKGIAFFDLFTAMGGRGSMKKLVDSNSANKDYTHINLKGGKIIAEHLFKSMVAGYDNYVRRNTKKN